MTNMRSLKVKTTKHQLLAGFSINPTTGNLCEIGALFKGNKGAAWNHSTTNDLGRIAQVVGTCIPTCTSTIFCIPHSEKHKDKKATYIWIIAADKVQKIEKKRVRWTASGDCIDYKDNLATPTSGLTTVKCHLNRVISTNGAKYSTMNIHDFYLGTSLTEY